MARGDGEIAAQAVRTTLSCSRQIVRQKSRHGKIFKRKMGPMKKSMFLYAALLLVIAGVVGLCFSSCDSEDKKKNKEILDKSVSELTDKELSQLAVAVRTNMGLFKIGLRPDWAPETSRHFVRMVKAGIYHEKQFHEVRPGVWILGGGPEPDNILAGPVPLEKPPGPVDEVRHHKGTVGLYHPDFMPDKGGVLFYIMLRDNPRMDGGYTAFGEVIEGMGAVDRIANVPITGNPRPYMPITDVVIQKVSLEVK